MKSIFKKILALLGCTAMLVTSFILPVSAENESDSIIIHAGDYPQLETVNAEGEKGIYNVITFTNADNGGKFIHLAADESNQNSVEGFKVNIPVEISKDGLYSINVDMCAHVRSLASENWNSPVKLKIDDREYFRVKNFATAAEPEVTAKVINTALSEKYAKDSERGRWAEYALNPVELSAGEHNLTFWVYDKPVNQQKDWFVFGLGDIKITEITDFSELDNITIHAGDYANLETVDAEGNKGIYTTTVFANSENGGSFIHLAADESDRNSVEGFKVIIPFKVYGNGAYNITVDMCSLSQCTKDSYRWASPVKLKIDDGEYTHIKAYATADAPNVTATVLTASLAEKYSKDSEKTLWSEYALDAVDLKSGEHTLTFWVYDKPPLQGKDWFVFGLGEININPVADAAELVIEGEDLIVEKASSIIVDENFNNGKYLNLTSDADIKKVFSVGESGDYKIKVTAAANVDYFIDGNMVSFGNSEDISWLPEEGWKQHISKPITLEKGIHEFEIKTNSETKAYKLDSIHILKELEITDISIVGADVLSVGDVVELIFENQDKDTMSANAFDSFVCESENKNIIGTDNLGRIKAKNAGEAVINFSAKVNGQTLNTSKKVFVAGKTGLYVQKTEVTDNNVEVTLASNSNASESKVIVEVCGIKDGLITSVKSMEVIEFGAISAGKSSIKSVAVPELAKDDVIIVFVVDGTDTLKPLWGKTVADR